MGERYSLSACIYGAVFVEGFAKGICLSYENTEADNLNA